MSSNDSIIFQEVQSNPVEENLDEFEISFQNEKLNLAIPTDSLHLEQKIVIPKNFADKILFEIKNLEADVHNFLSLLSKNDEKSIDERKDNLTVIYSANEDANESSFLKRGNENICNFTNLLQPGKEKEKEESKIRTLEEENERLKKENLELKEQNTKLMECLKSTNSTLRYFKKNSDECQEKNELLLNNYVKMSIESRKVMQDKAIINSFSNKTKIEKEKESFLPILEKILLPLKQLMLYLKASSAKPLEEKFNKVLEEINIIADDSLRYLELFCPSSSANFYPKNIKSLHSRSKSASKNKSRAYESANKTNEKIASVERITKTEHSSRKTKHISQITNDDNDNSKKKINNIKENSKKNDLESKKTKNIQGFREKTNLKKYQTCNEENKANVEDALRKFLFKNLKK